MSSQTPRIVISAERGEGRAIGEALEKCKELSRGVIVLLVQTKGHLKIPALQAALGADAVRTLEKGDSVHLPEGNDLRVATLRKTDEISQQVIILAVHPNEKMLDIIDDVIQPTGIVVVAWDSADIREWIRTWTPDILGQPPVAEDPLFDDETRMAFDAFKKRANVGGRLHPYDRTAAIQMLKDFKNKGRSIDPLAVRAWALREHWGVAGADQWKDLAEGVRDGKPFRTQ